MRVSGCKPAMILTSAGAFAIATAGVHAGAGAGDFFSKDSANRAGDEPMGASGLEGMALAGGGFESFPRGFASEASEEVVCGFHAFNVALCYRERNNLYRHSPSRSAGMIAR